MHLERMKGQKGKITSNDQTKISKNNIFNSIGEILKYTVKILILGISGFG